MMLEVEVKVKTEHAQVRERLDSLNATHLEAITQVDTYYNHPSRDFGETDEAVRIRQESTSTDDSAAQLTYKGPLVDDASKTRREHELDIDDAETGDEILRLLGFTPVATVRKERDRFALHGVEVSLDGVASLGDFVEVETTASDADLDEAREQAFKITRALGLDPGDQIRRSYLELLLDSDDGAPPTGE